MSNILINAVPQRVQYTANGVDTVFAVPWPFFNNTDLNVYTSNPVNYSNQVDAVNIDLFPATYTVQGAGNANGGTITFAVAPIAAMIITIEGNCVVDRPAIYDTSSVITKEQLNQDFDNVTVQIKKLETWLKYLTPQYAQSEQVLPGKVELPLLDTGESWIGTPTGLAKFFAGGAGMGNVVAAHPNMRASIVLWTGADFVITDSNINIVANLITPTVGDPANSQSGFADTWGAMHWPAHITGNRPIAPNNGDTYYDTSTNEFFGYVNGAWVPFGQVNTQSQIIIQANAFAPGQWVRVDNATQLYVLAQSDTPLHGESWWMVTAATGAQFTIQGGVSFIQGAFLTPIIGGAGNIGVPFYLSDVTPGLMTTVIPAVVGEVNKPLFIPDRLNGGWIISARGYIIGNAVANGANGPNYVQANFANAFIKGDVIYATGANTYALATAQGTFAEADNIGIVSTAGSPIFTYQTEGNAVNIITQDELGNPIVPGTQYWLSDNVAHAGKVTSTKPTTLGHFTVPVYQPYDVAAGVIARQRPLIIAPSGAGGSQLITSVNLANQASLTLSNILDGTYQDIQIVGENIIVRETVSGNYFAQNVAITLELGGALQAGPFVFNGGATFWTNDNNNVATIGGKSFNFTVDVKGVDSITTYKIADVYFNYFPNSNTFLPQRSTFGVGTNVFSQGGAALNKAAMTGFEILFSPASTYIFVSGTVSVYGTQT